MHSPSDIMSSDHTGIHPYSDTFGKSEYETIAEVLVGASQEAGEWVSLPESAFLPAFETHARASYIIHYRLAQMADETPHLERDGENFRLTEKAIEKLVLKHPAV